MRENQEEEAENKPNFGTLTLRRKKEEKERDQKMEQLKKKIKTDDEREWMFSACRLIFIIYFLPPNRQKSCAYFVMIIFSAIS